MLFADPYTRSTTAADAAASAATWRNIRKWASRNGTDIPPGLAESIENFLAAELEFNAPNRALELASLIQGKGEPGEGQGEGRGSREPPTSGEGAGGQGEGVEALREELARALKLEGVEVLTEGVIHRLAGLHINFTEGAKELHSQIEEDIKAGTFGLRTGKTFWNELPRNVIFRKYEDNPLPIINKLYPKDILPSSWIAQKFKDPKPETHPDISRPGLSRRFTDTDREPFVFSLFSLLFLITLCSIPFHGFNLQALNYSANLTAAIAAGFLALVITLQHFNTVLYFAVLAIVLIGVCT